MKKTLLAIILSATAVSSAFAADGTINFTGSVTTDACKIVTTPDVAMGKVSSSSFTKKGDLSAASAFTIKLTECPEAGSTSATVKFDGTADGGDNNVLALTGGAGSANGLGLQISDSTGKIVPLATASSTYTLVKKDATKPTILGNNDLQFTARYIATADTVTAGVANATAQFTVNYN